MNAREEWRPVVGFPAYEVSSEGRVRRCEVSARGHAVTGDCLKLAASKGKAYVHVSLCRDGQKKSIRVNRMVCEAFHGPPPSPAHHAAHNDGEASNNRAGNLRWATPVGNEGDKRAHGTAAIGERHWSKLQPDRRARGERHGRTSLTAEIVREIRADTRPQRIIAASLGISQRAVWSVKNRVTWGHVQ